MEGLLIWIVMIAISSLLKNMSNKKKQEKRTQQPQYNVKSNNDDRPSFNKKDKDLIKKAFQQFDEIFEVEKSYTEPKKIENEIRIDDLKTANNINMEESSYKSIEEEQNNFDKKDKKLQSKDIQKTIKSIKEVEIKDMNVTKKSNISIKISKNSIVNGLVMSEILGKPRSRN